MNIKIGSLIRKIPIDGSNPAHQPFCVRRPTDKSYNLQIWFGDDAYRHEGSCASHPRNEGTGKIVEVVASAFNIGLTKYYIGAPATEQLYLTANVDAKGGPYTIIPQSFVEVVPRLPLLATEILPHEAWRQDRDSTKIQALYLRNGVLQRFKDDRSCEFEDVIENLEPMGNMYTAHKVHWGHGDPFTVPDHDGVVSQIPKNVFEQAYAYVFNIYGHDRAWRDGYRQVVTTFYRLA